MLSCVLCSVILCKDLVYCGGNSPDWKTMTRAGRVNIVNLDPDWHRPAIITRGRERGEQTIKSDNTALCQISIRLSVTPPWLVRLVCPRSPPGRVCSPMRVWQMAEVEWWRVIHPLPGVIVLPISPSLVVTQLVTTLTSHWSPGAPCDTRAAIIEQGMWIMECWCST